MNAQNMCSELTVNLYRSLLVRQSTFMELLWKKEDALQGAVGDENLYAEKKHSLLNAMRQSERWAFSNEDKQCILKSLN